MSSTLPQLGVDDLIEGEPDHRERQHDEHDADAGRHDPPPRAQRGGVSREGALDDAAPREAERVAQAQERERGLGAGILANQNSRLASTNASIAQLASSVRCSRDATVHCRSQLYPR